MHARFDAITTIIKHLKFPVATIALGSRLEEISAPHFDTKMKVLSFSQFILRAVFKQLFRFWTALNY